MRTRFDLKTRKDRKKWRGIAGDNLSKVKWKKEDIRIVFFDSKNVTKLSGRILVVQSQTNY